MIIILIYKKAAVLWEMAAFARSDAPLFAAGYLIPDSREGI